MHHRISCASLLALFVAFTAVSTEAATNVTGDTTASSESKIEWMTDYATAMYRAKAENKMLLIAFCGKTTENFAACLESDVLVDPKVQEQLDAFLLVKLPNDVHVDLSEEKNIELLKHSTFREMCGMSGIAMIDFRDSGAEYYGHVVSTFPTLGRKPYNKNQFLTMLGLPAGTLTQRTLVYAVRIHPESPKSTEGTLSTYLTSEALSHSQYQARIRLQGHHNWESRFHRIISQLPGGLLATEVCAESWPNQGLLEAALDCVYCWHYSSGHWRQVNGFHKLWGYDMRRGSNRIWYATGIFSQQR